MVTLSEIEQVAREAHPGLTSYLNCGAINPEIRDALEEELDVAAEFIVGSISKPRTRRVHGEEHAFVKVPAEEVEDARTDVIVDGALDQFNASNYEERGFFISLGPKDDIPNPAVLTGDDGYDCEYELYEVYNETPPPE